MTHHYRVLEDVALADAAFEATGDSPSELFLSASQAVIETLADPSTVGVSWRRTIERNAPDLQTLLFDWLGEIIYLKDAEAVVFSGVVVDVEHLSDKGWRLHATLTGEPVDGTRQELRADVKAVTKHLYDVREYEGKWEARVVLDL